MLCPCQLDEYHEFVCEILTNKFVSLAVQWDEDDDDTGYDDNDNEVGDGNGYDDAAATDDDGFLQNTTTSRPKTKKSKAAPSSSEASLALDQLLLALLKCDRLASALNMYKGRLSDAVKLVVRTCVQVTPLRLTHTY